MTEKIEFTEKDLQTLRELQARQKKWQRAQKAFYKEIDSRREEVLDHLNHTDRLEQIADAYDTDSDTLFNLLMSDAQISAFKEMQQKEDNMPANDAESIADGDGISANGNDSYY